MKTVPLTRLVQHCDRLLRHPDFTDWDGAVNGLQAENDGRVTRLAAAVDARRATLELAVAQHADLLLVHHGLFWTPTHPWTGSRRAVLRLVIQNNLAVYSSHLPLDAHPRLGNTARLAVALGLKRLRPFFIEKGAFIGFRSATLVPRAELAERLALATGRPPVVLPGGPALCHRIGVVTGGAGSELRQAAAEGIDTFVTGEGPHWTHAAADELGINVLYGGHYATETFGVKALAEHLSDRFGLPWVFLDYPTGL